MNGLCAASSLVFAGLTAALPAPPPGASQPTPQAREAEVIKFNFDADATGTLPEGWKAEGTSQKGPVATWRLAEAAGAPSAPNVLALASVNHESGGTYNICWTDRVKFRDGTIEVKVLARAGEEDRGGGPIWRVRDRDNYMIARWNPLEENFRLYYVKDGGRKQLASAKVTGVPDQWHTIRIEQRGASVTCSLDGKVLLEATDDHIPGEGGVGVWTKADAATSFDDLTITPGAKPEAPGAKPGGG